MAPARSPARPAAPPADALSLSGRHILVVEDEVLLAIDMEAALQAAGAEVVGPAHGLDAAGRLLATFRVDAAVLDVDLRGEEVFPLADTLLAAGVPLVFTTGHLEVDLPGRFAPAAHFAKPVDVARVIEAVSRAIRRNPVPAWNPPRR